MKNETNDQNQNERSGQMNVQVRLFGAFRNLGQSEVTLTLPKATVTTVEMKTLLATHFSASPQTSNFNASSLVEKSALANDSSVLGDDELIQPGARLALLPPVSGG
ncbi:MAG: hypothetical protein EOP05_23590 [Proteobacteria bacterium]|nr:MAG: hypothetical protein EOP05_23590 [Pseudomonadota bacterium]